MNSKINIIIVDDNKVFLEGVSSFLKDDPKFNIIAQFTSGIELINYPHLALADIVLLDIEMPEMNGIETAKIVNQKCRHIKLIAVTMYQDKVYLRQLVEAGFRTFVNKVNVTETILEAIETTLAGKYNFPSDLKLN